jgi:hypothetical protein
LCRGGAELHGQRQTCFARGFQKPRDVEMRANPEMDVDATGEEIGSNWKCESP